MMVIHAAFTGMRWGEIIGLDRAHCRTGSGYLLVDPDVGALHEVAGRLWLGPPKSEATARRIDLPPFLAELLEEVIDAHLHTQVFAGRRGRWLRRSNVTRRIWRPACDGDPERGWSPILPGAVFHGLRHFHKTLLDETGLPEVIVCERMGHRMPGIRSPSYAVRCTVAGVTKNIPHEGRGNSRNRVSAPHRAGMMRGHLEVVGPAA